MNFWSVEGRGPEQLATFPIPPAFSLPPEEGRSLRLKRYPIASTNASAQPGCMRARMSRKLASVSSPYCSASREASKILDKCGPHGENQQSGKH
jgi:hypothetical protein